MLKIIFLLLMSGGIPATSCRGAGCGSCVRDLDPVDPAGPAETAGRLRLDLAQYRELEAFAAFGSDLDAASKAQLERGARMVELLKQGQYSPYSVEREAVSIWAGTTGKMDSVAVSDIRRFEAGLLEFIATRHPQLFEVIAATRELSDDTIASLTKVIDEFKLEFQEK